MHSMVKRVVMGVALAAGVTGFAGVAAAKEADEVRRPQLRIVPVVENGKQTGFKILALDPESVFARYDLRTGDVLRSVNGTPLDGPHKLLNAYEDFNRGATSAVVIALEREGKEVVLVFGETRADAAGTR